VGKPVRRTAMESQDEMYAERDRKLARWSREDAARCYQRAALEFRRGNARAGEEQLRAGSSHMDDAEFYEGRA